MVNLVLILYLSTLFSVAAGGWYNPFARSSASILDAGAIQQSNVEERLRVRHRLNNLYTQQRRTVASFRILRLPPLLTTHQRFPPAAARPYDPLLRLLSLSLQMLHLRPAMVAMRLRSTAAAAAMTNAEVYSAVADHIAERTLLRPPLRRHIVRAFGSDDESWKTNFSRAPVNLVRAVLPLSSC